jgi:hypothetical protein
MYILVRILFVDQWRASCENIFWSIDGELLIGMDLLSMIEDLFWGREREEDLMDASKVRQYQWSWWQNYQNFRNPSFWCIHGLSVYRVRIHWGIHGLDVYRVSMYARFLKKRSVWWIEWWRLVPSSCMIRQVPDLHFMASDLSLRHWYNYIIVFMNTIVWCDGNA